MSLKKESRQWLEKAAASSVDKVAQSAVYAGIVTDSFLKDPVCALQLGYAILLDKPIFLIADKNCVLPGNLVKIAKVIERVDLRDSVDIKRATDSIAKYLEQFR